MKRKEQKKKEYYYFDENSKMSLINNFKDWVTGNGEGDALWRTGIAYITTGDKKYRNGIIEAFKLEKTYLNSGYLREYHYQARRCNPDIGVDDVSRDQVILAWASLYLNNDNDSLKEIINHTKYRLSKRYTMTPTMWLWAKGLIGDKFYGLIGQFFLMFELAINVVWNKLLYLIIGVKEYSQDDLEKMLDERGEAIRFECINSKFKQMLWKMDFPGYGLHLASWMNYTSKSSIIKTINNWLISKDMAKGNLLLRLLTEKEVTVNEIDNYKPMEEWAWSSRMTKCNRQRILPETFGNEFDKEILYSIKQRNEHN